MTSHLHRPQADIAAEEGNPLNSGWHPKPSEVESAPSHTAPHEAKLGQAKALVTISSETATFDDGAADGFADLDEAVVEGIVGRPVRPPLIFPVAIENCLDGIARVHSLPRIMATSAFLVIAGAAIGTRVRARAGAVWSEPPNLWACLVTPAGWRRMSIATSLSKLLLTIEAGELTRWQEALGKLVQERLLHDAALKGHATLAKRAELEGRPEPPPPTWTGGQGAPVMPRIVVHETAPPAIVEAAAAGRGLFYMVEEGGKLLRAAQPGEPLGDLVLAGYDGDAFNVPSAMHDDIRRIEAFGLSLLIGTVPAALADLKVERNHQLFARIMWIAPARKPAFAIARNAADLTVIENILSVLRSWGETEHELVLSVHAVEVLEQAVRCWEQEAARLGGGPASAWLERAGTHAMRVALAIEMLRAATAVEPRRPRKISSGTLAAAVRFVDLVLVPGMMEALAASGATVPAGLAERVIRYVVENKLATVNRRDLSRGHRGLFPDGPALRQAFDSLAIAGVLRPVGNLGAKGRPSVSYEVNPRLRVAVEKRRFPTG